MTYSSVLWVRRTTMTWLITTWPAVTNHRATASAFDDTAIAVISTRGGPYIISETGTIHLVYACKALSANSYRVVPVSVIMALVNFIFNYLGCIPLTNLEQSSLDSSQCALHVCRCLSRQRR